MKKIVGNNKPEPLNGDVGLKASNQSLISNSSSQPGSYRQGITDEDSRHVEPPRVPDQRRFDRQDSVGRASVASAPQTGPASPGRYVRTSIIRGPKGFGFTIADSQFGQRIKEIFDRNRCRGLQEGDLIVEINNKVVRNIDHSEVVNVLKSCPQNEAAEFVLQRGGTFLHFSKINLELVWLKGLFDPACFARVVAWLAFVVAIFMGHEKSD